MPSSAADDPLVAPIPDEACVVIVGAGQAGAQAAFTLREQGFAGRVVLVGAEPHRPYMRPPLSKQVLAGDFDLERLPLRPADLYAQQAIDLRLSCAALRLDRDRRRVHLADGSVLPYDRLLLATGSRPRTLPFLPAAHPQVRVLRTLDDALALRGRLHRGQRLVVIGGGYVGLEVAATAARRGLAVAVLEQAPRVLERVTTPQLSAFVEAEHRAHGVDLRCGVQVTGPSMDGERLSGVVVDGTVLDADLVLVGVGAIPNVELAQAAGLDCDDGIVVDESCRTSDPHVFAAGDCTRHPNPLYQRRLRLESVQNAVDQGTVAALAMTGKAARYARVPWFWSQQYDLKLQSAGLAEGHDEVVERGDRALKRFALLYRRAGQLVGVDAVNLPGEYLSARKTIAARGELPAAPLVPSTTPGTTPAPGVPPQPTSPSP